MPEVSAEIQTDARGGAGVTGRLALLVVLGGVLFWGLMGVSMMLYPGGHSGDLQAPGHSFLYNYWCDLLGARSRSGQANPVGAPLASAGFVCFSVVFAAFVLLACRVLAQPSNLFRCGAVLGGLGALGALLVGTTPDRWWPAGHAGLVSVSGGLGVLATTLMMPGLWCRPRSGLRALVRLERALGALALAFSAWNLFQYVREAFFAASAFVWLAGVQKSASICLMGWMMVTALANLRKVREFPLVSRS